MRFNTLKIQFCSHTFLEATKYGNNSTDKSHNSKHTQDDNANGGVHFTVSVSLSLHHGGGHIELRGVRGSVGVSIVSVFCDLLIQL